MLSQYHITCFSTNIHQNNYLFLSVWNQSIIWNKENSLCEAYFWNPLEYDVKSIKLHTILNMPIFTLILIAPTKGIVESWQRKNFFLMQLFSSVLGCTSLILFLWWVGLIPPVYLSLCIPSFLQSNGSPRMMTAFKVNQTGTSMGKFTNRYLLADYETNIQWIVDSTKFNTFSPANILLLLFNKLGDYHLIQ